MSNLQYCACGSILWSNYEQLHGKCIDCEHMDELGKCGHCGTQLIIEAQPGKEPEFCSSRCEAAYFELMWQLA